MSRVRTVVERGRQGLAELDEIREDVRRSDPAVSARLLRLVEVCPVFPPGLVLLAGLEQLSEGKEGAPTLVEIRDLLELASEGEERGGDAALELAHFASAVEDDGAGALTVVERAWRRKERELIALLAYRVRLHEESGNLAEARRCLEEGRERFPAATEWAELRRRSSCDERGAEFSSRSFRRR